MTTFCDRILFLSSWSPSLPISAEPSPFQGIKKHHIDRREVKSEFVDLKWSGVQQCKKKALVWKGRPFAVARVSKRFIGELAPLSCTGAQLVAAPWEFHSCRLTRMKQACHQVFLPLPDRRHTRVVQFRIGQVTRLLKAEFKSGFALLPLRLPYTRDKQGGGWGRRVVRVQRGESSWSTRPERKISDAHIGCIFCGWASPPPSCPRVDTTITYSTLGLG